MCTSVINCKSLLDTGSPISFIAISLLPDSVVRIVVYFDDIIVASANISEHIELVASVLRCLARNGLELRFSKCKFAFIEIEYLGYDVYAAGIKPSQSHVRAIRNYPVPTNPLELHSYLGTHTSVDLSLHSQPLLDRYTTLQKRTFHSTSVPNAIR